MHFAPIVLLMMTYICITYGYDTTVNITKDECFMKGCPFDWCEETGDCIETYFSKKTINCSSGWIHGDKSKQCSSNKIEFMFFCGSAFMIFCIGCIMIAIKRYHNTNRDSCSKCFNFNNYDGYVEI